MSIAVSPLGEVPIGAQAVAGGKKNVSAAPANRRAVAKADTPAQPEAR
jgi:hypothetical protein